MIALDRKNKIFKQLHLFYQPFLLMPLFVLDMVPIADPAPFAFQSMIPMHRLQVRKFFYCNYKYLF